MKPLDACATTGVLASCDGAVVGEMAQGQHPPDDLGEVSGLLVGLNLEDGPGGPVSQVTDDCELIGAPQFSARSFRRSSKRQTTVRTGIDSNDWGSTRLASIP